MAMLAIGDGGSDRCKLDKRHVVVDFDNGRSNTLAVRITNRMGPFGCAKASQQKALSSDHVAAVQILVNGCVVY